MPKNGVYQIKDTFINFWFKFVFPHMSDLYLLKPHEFYDRYIAPGTWHISETLFPECLHGVYDAFKSNGTHAVSSS